MITRLGMGGLGDGELDYTSALYAPPTSGGITTPPPPSSDLTPEQAAAIYNAASSAQDELTTGIKSPGGYTVSPTGQVSNTSPVGNFLSSLFGGSGTYVGPKMPASQVGVTTFMNPFTGGVSQISTSSMVMVGGLVVGFVLLNSLLKKSGR
jgi:hypothetical protein